MGVPKLQLHNIFGISVLFWDSVRGREHTVSKLFNTRHK